MGEENVIRQEELKAFYEKKAAIEADEKVLAGMKQTFVDRKGLGAKVEDGPFELSVESYTQNRTDAKVLVESIAQQWGEDVAKKMKEEASKPVAQTRVSVKMR